ncbi:MAG: sensor histidine kinase [Clostridia bacterium]
MLKDKNIIIILTILLQAILIIFINQYITITQNIEDIKKFLSAANMLIVFLTGCALYSLKVLGEDIKKQIEQNILKSHLQQVESLIKTLHSQKHEYTRHIQTIQAMLYLGEFDNAKTYMNGVVQDYRHTGSMIHTDNPALTALLNSKSEVAANKNIVFDFAIKCDLSKLNIPPWDLTSILGNLMDNAFEAVLEVRNNRRVGLEIKFEEGQYIIYVYNNGTKLADTHITNIFEAGFSTKDSEARGYGLYIVKKLVDKYQGKIKVVNDERTAFIVYLPCREVKNDSRYIETGGRHAGKPTGS